MSVVDSENLDGDEELNGRRWRRRRRQGERQNGGTAEDELIEGKG